MDKVELEINDENIQDFMVPMYNDPVFHIEDDIKFNTIQAMLMDKFLTQLKSIMKMSGQEIYDKINEELKDFQYQIKKRGEDIYWDRKFIWITIVDNFVVGLVNGSNGEKYVSFFDASAKHLDCNCDCPYDGLCKHIYALMYAVQQFIEITDDEVDSMNTLSIDIIYDDFKE